MLARRFLLWVLLASVWVSLGFGQDVAPTYFGASPGALVRAKSLLQKGDPALQAALKELLAEADEARNVAPASVMEKSKLPPSGDKHDYMSTAPYFWPDPASSNGLPYIRHDGRVNPESRGAASDHPRLGSMAANVETLALAYYFSGKEPYAAHGAQCVRVWFLDPATRMNPHLNFAQAIPGLNTGRGTGIIEGRNLALAADATTLLAGSPSWTPKDAQALKTWLGHYLDWLLTSENGRDEAAARNNHGTFYDVQAMRLALVLGRTQVAKQLAESARQKRILVQIEPDGKQPLELARTASFGYSRFNLEALFTLATLSEHVGVDLWNFRTADGRTMRKALDFLVPYISDPAKKWPYEQIRHSESGGFAPLLRQAAVEYHEPKYERLLQRLEPGTSRRFELLCPQDPHP